MGFATDIEGNMAYLCRYVARSRVVRWDASDASRLDLVDPTRHYFVFGGDLFDKGPHDERLSRLLVDLKRRYPTRVFLLMGNRDINKLRLASELSPTDLARPLAEIDVVPGFHESKTIANYLAEHGAANTAADGSSA